MFQFPARRQTKSVCTLITNWTKDTHTSAGHDTECTCKNSPWSICAGWRCGMERSWSELRSTATYSGISPDAVDTYPLGRYGPVERTMDWWWILLPKKWKIIISWVLLPNRPNGTLRDRCFVQKLTFLQSFLKEFCSMNRCWSESESDSRDGFGPDCLHCLRRDNCWFLAGGW